MKIELINKKLKQIKADCEIVFVADKKLNHKWIEEKKFLDEEGYKGEAEETTYLPHKKILYVGITSLAHEDVRIGAGQAIRVLKKTKNKSAKIGLYGIVDGNSRAITEGLLLGMYNFDKYKSKKEKVTISRILIANEEYENKKIDFKKVKAGVIEGKILAEATNFTRDIVNQTPEEVTPLTMSAEAKKLAKKNRLQVKVYGEEYLKKKGMGAFYAVSKASPYPPQLIHLIYKPKKAKAKIVLVGKGLTFDAGGLNVKPEQSMLTMKSDKSGASAILGIMKAVSELKFPFEIHGIIGATENVIGQHAYKPDDVLKAKNGKTIEVKNTDAEGRLVLADCLCYAQEIKLDYIIDLATLTGACMVALGEYTIGAMSHNHELAESFFAAGEKSGELITDLPFNRYLPKLIKSEVADISNISSSRYGGAITAGLFLSEFIEKKNKDKWVHLDIAGPSYVQHSWGYNPFGASGAGVRLLVAWLKNLKK